LLLGVVLREVVLMAVVAVQEDLELELDFQ
jgi:hypothetical protein